MVILLYGYGLVFFISCFMGYQVSFLNAALICGVAFILSISLLRDKKTIGISLAILTLIAIIGNRVLVHLGYLEWIIDEFVGFIEPYYLSLVNSSVEIDVVRQSVLMLIIATALYKIIHVVKGEKYILDVLLSSGFILCIVGYLTNNLTSTRDQYGFVLFGAVNLLLYFYYYFIQHRASLGSSKNSFKPFAVLSMLFIIVVIGLSYMLYLKDPRPFELPQKVGHLATGTINSQMAPNLMKEAYDYEVSQGGKISDEFVFTGVELFQVKTEHTKYLKGLVYETYKDGTWSQAEKGLYLPVEVSEVLADIPSELEDITINFTNINSNVLFVSSQDIQGLKVETTTQVMKDNARGTFSLISDHEVTIKEDLEYSFQAITRRMKDPLMVDLLKTNTTQSLEINKTAYAMPEGFEDIKTLALEVTKDAYTEYDQVQAITDYLKNNYTYTVKPDITNRNGVDPVHYFLFGNKQGFCQHFATSAILMMRSLGIPARYVNGFYVDTEIDYEDVIHNYEAQALIASGYKQVRDNNAHAWLEVFFPQKGWIMYEATPGKSPEESNTESIDLSQEALNTADKTNTQANGRDLLTVMIVLLIVIFMALLVWSVIKGVMTRRRYKLLKPSDQLKVYYMLINSYLKVIRFEKHSYETPREYSSRVDQKGKISSDLKFNALIESYENVLYGQYESSAEEVSLYKRYLKDIKKEAISNSGFLRCLKTMVKELLMT